MTYEEFVRKRKAEPAYSLFKDAEDIMILFWKTIHHPILARYVQRQFEKCLMKTTKSRNTFVMSN